MTATTEPLTRRGAYAAGLLALPVVLAIVFIVQLYVLADRLAASAVPLGLCTTGALHTSGEPPDLPLTRDYAVLRILLKDPADHFDRMRQLYDGALRAPKAERLATFLGKRAERLTLARDRRQPRSLRSEAERIDRERGSRIAEAIEQSFAERDRAAIEAGFRRMFAALLDETLVGIQERLQERLQKRPQGGLQKRPEQSATPARSFQYVRRFYSAGLEAHLALKSPTSSLAASAALDGMRHALETQGSPDAVNVFERERRHFMRTVKEAVEL